LSEKY